jgi:hypothetical protein
MSQPGRPAVYSYNEFSDKLLSGEDWMVSMKFPQKVCKEEWVVVMLDTVKRTCDTFEGHYYTRVFRKLDENSVARAVKAESEIKTMSEIQFEEEPVYF